MNALGLSVRHTLVMSKLRSILLWIVVQLVVDHAVHRELVVDFLYDKFYNKID